MSEGICLSLQPKCHSSRYLTYQMDNKLIITASYRSFSNGYPLEKEEEVSHGLCMLANLIDTSSGVRKRNG